MIILLIAGVISIALLGGVIAVVRRPRLAPSSVEDRLSTLGADHSGAAVDSAYQRRQYDWTVEYDSPVGAQRVVLDQSPASFGELAAAETARTTAMLYRGTTIEIWTEHRTTHERVCVDTVQVASRRAA